MEIRRILVSIEPVIEWNAVKLKTKVDCIGKLSMADEQIIAKEDFIPLFDIMFDEAKRRIRKFVLKEQNNGSSKNR